MSRFLSLHAIQPVPDSYVNRGEDGRPKTSLYGGTPRLRVSSQAWKWAMRHYLREKLGPKALAVRTRHVAELVAEALGGGEEDLRLARVLLAGIFSGASGDEGMTRTLLFVSPGEVRRLAEVLSRHRAVLKAKLEEVEEAREKERKKLARAIEELVREHGERPEDPEVRRELGRLRRRLEALEQGVARVDLPAEIQKEVEAAFADPEMTVDLALFGRMLAEVERARRVDAAMVVAPALGVAAYRPEVDYFTAVDELSDPPVAGLIGEREFGSAVFYRHAVIDLDRLASNLGDTGVGRAAALAVEAFLLSFPYGGRAWASRSLPTHAAAALEESGVNLAGAFERPLEPRLDVPMHEQAWARLVEWWGRVGEVYGLVPAEVRWFALPEEAPPPPGERVERVRGVRDLAEWAQGVADGGRG